MLLDDLTILDDDLAALLEITTTLDDDFATLLEDFTTLDDKTVVLLDFGDTAEELLEIFSSLAMLDDDFGFSFGSVVDFAELLDSDLSCSTVS